MFDCFAAPPAPRARALDASEDECDGAAYENPSIKHKKRSSSTSPTAAFAGDALQTLVSLQDFDGSFELTARLASSIKVAMETIAQTAGAAGVSELIMATAFAVAYFETKLADLADDWQLVVMKARKWLSKSCKSAGADMDATLAKACALLG